MAKKIALLVGSLRRESYNRKIANELIRLASEGLELSIVEISDLPFYNEDLDEGEAPAAWQAYREKIRNSDGVIFISPEYNRSVPAVLKNAIDVGSRPKGQGSINGKPAGIITSSPGSFGGFAANHHIRQSLVPLGMPAMQQPEAYIGNVAKLFQEDGKTVVEATENILKKFLDRYQQWVSKILTKAAAMRLFLFPDFSTKFLHSAA